MKTDKIEAMGACNEAVLWLQTQKSMAQAWKNCERGDWMLWLLGRLDKSAPWSEDRKPLVRACCAIARKALGYAKGPAAENCIVTAEAWCGGKASQEQVVKARMAAAAADAAAAYADAAVAYATAATASDAAYATAVAAYATTAVAAYATAAARRAFYKESAAIVRRFFPKAPKIKTKKENV